MAAQDDDKGSGIFRNTDPEAFKAEFVTRMIVSAARLPRLCVLKKCRRRKRCFGPDIDDLLCLRRHGALSKAQLERALKRLGWPNLNEDGTPIERKVGNGQSTLNRHAGRHGGAMLRMDGRHPCQHPQAGQSDSRSAREDSSDRLPHFNLRGSRPAPG